MADINISRTHRYGKSEIDGKVCELAQKLVDKHGGSYKHHGQTVDYSTTGVNARVTYDDLTVDVEVTLGFLMKGLSGLLKGEIESYLDRYV